MDLFNNILGIFDGFVASKEGDSWLWKSEGSGGFWAKLCYLLLEKRCLIDGGVRDAEKIVFRYIWKSPAPSKIIGFSLSLLIDRIPTRVNLVYRRVLNEGASVR